MKKKCFRIVLVIFTTIILFIAIGLIVNILGNKSDQNFRDSELVSYKDDDAEEKSEESDTVDFTSEWNKSFGLFEELDTHRKLKLTWYDGGYVNVIIDGAILYSFNLNDYEILSDDNVSFICSDGTSITYNLTNNFIELSSGNYQGIYHAEEPSTNINVDSYTDDEKIALNYTVNNKSFIYVLQNGHYDNYDLQETKNTVEDITYVTITFWYKNSTEEIKSAYVMFKTNNAVAVPACIYVEGIYSTNNLDKQIESLIDTLLSDNK